MKPITHALMVLTLKIVTHASILASNRSSWFLQWAFTSVWNALLPPNHAWFGSSIRHCFMRPVYFWYGMIRIVRCYAFNQELLLPSESSMCHDLASHLTHSKAIFGTLSFDLGCFPFDTWPSRRVSVCAVMFCVILSLIEYGQSFATSMFT